MHGVYSREIAIVDKLRAAIHAPDTEVLSNDNGHVGTGICPEENPKDPSVLKIVRRANSLQRENSVRKSQNAMVSAQKCLFF